MKRISTLLLAIGVLVQSALAGDWVTYEGNKGPGKGRHIVFLTGDEEYRSEEALPQLAKILAVRHGFKCTVLFSTDADRRWLPQDALEAVARRPDRGLADAGRR